MYFVRATLFHSAHDWDRCIEFLSIFISSSHMKLTLYMSKSEYDHFLLKWSDRMQSHNMSNKYEFTNHSEKRYKHKSKF